MTTRRILFVCHDAGGNVPPVLALAESLIRNGHHAAVLSQPSVRRRAADIGCEFFEFSAIGDYERGKMLEEQLDAAMSVIAERSAGDDLISLATERGIDVIVVDANMAGALAAAETLRQPSVVLLHSMYKTYVDVWLGAVWPLLSNTVNSMRSGFGLGAADSWVDLLAGHDCRISVVPSMFEAPVTDIQMPLRHFGFLVPPVPASDSRAWFPPGDAPTVLVGLSTTHHRQTELMQTIVAVLGEMPVRALVTTAGVVDTESWRRPSNVTIADYVPHASVMDQTDVMVNHAGLGSVAAALSFSVPMLCIPDGRDQPLNAPRAADLGAALVLDGECSAHEIRSAIEEIVARPAYKNAAASIAQASRLEGGPNLAATALVAIA